MVSTKEEFRGLMHRLLDPLKPHYSPGGARLRLEGAGAIYSRDVIELEGFSRPLWALVPFWMGGGHDADFEDIYRRGLANGADPDHPEYWGGFAKNDQRFVEQAAIACGLLFAPEILWQPQTPQARQNIARWLYGINGYTRPDNNWQFFGVLVNIALKRLGMPYDAARLAQSLDRIEDYYLKDGWYQDGLTGQRDYYVSFALHYYGLLYARVMEQEDPERAARYRARSDAFSRDFILWFAENGAALPYGRSLTYRFAQAAFWPACLFSGVRPFPEGVIKGILARHFDYWLSQDIFDRDGILTVGYAYPNLIMSEYYNAPGSPYWGMKSFLVLALPDGDPFWQAQPAPLPPLPALQALPQAAILLQRQNGEVTAYPAGACERYGCGHVPEKYAKFAYSTRFGFCCARSQLMLEENCPDSMLAFVLDGADYVFVRRQSRAWQVLADRIVSEWSPLPGIEVTTTITPTPTGHRRRHEIESTLACTAYDCGFAVEKFLPDSAQQAAAGWAWVRGGGARCAVSGMGEGCFVNAEPNTNVLYPNAEIPALRYRLAPGRTVLETEIVVESLSAKP